MPEENKLGTSVTYVDPMKRGRPVQVQGISFAPGKAVDLARLMGQEKGERLARKLSVNHHFSVEGGPDHSEIREDLEARRFQHEQDIQRTYRKQVDQRRRTNEDDVEPEAPEGYQAPEANTLEGTRAPHTPSPDGRTARTKPAGGRS